MWDVSAGLRVDEITWVDAIVRYLVRPREAGSVKTRLIPKLLALSPNEQRVRRWLL